MTEDRKVFAGHGAIVLGFDGAAQIAPLDADHGAIVLLNLPASWGPEDVLQVLGWCDERQQREEEKNAHQA